MPAWAKRLERLREGWRASGDLCVISSLVNITYLTGQAASAGLLVQSPADTWLLLDGRYTTSARELAAQGRLADVQIVDVDAGFDDALTSLVQQAGAARIVFEPEQVTVAQLRKWQIRMPAEWVPAEPLVEPLRLTKDAYEIEVLTRAGRLLSSVADRLATWVRAGRREREVAADIDRALVAAGFTKPAFDTIVASGPNSALPHARPGDRALAEGDLVVLDFGGVLEGYCVDLTRMAAVGRVAPDAHALYEAVREAHGAALAAVAAGVAARDVDAAARQVLDSKGLGSAFVHGTGHGLGLEVHEAPRLSRLVPPEQQLRAGMVCTIEPGAYVPGLGGARLEDDVVVTDRGAQLLTTTSRDLLILHL
jgi:Xaa-Pro aminopeptidase